MRSFRFLLAATSQIKPNGLASHEIASRYKCPLNFYPNSLQQRKQQKACERNTVVTVFDSQAF